MLRRLESLSMFSRQRFKHANDTIDTAAIGITQQPAAERREAGAEDHANVDVFGTTHDPFAEAHRGFVDHRQKAAILNFDDVAFEFATLADERINSRIDFFVLAFINIK